MLLVETDWEDVGTTPLVRTLPKGSYLAVLESPSCEETRYPFVIDRCGSHECVVSLPCKGSVLEEFVYVPGGSTRVGGESRELAALPRERVTVKDFFVARYAVTLGEYCGFLNDSLAPDDPQLADYLPILRNEKYVERNPDGIFVPIDQLDSRVPVISVPSAASHAYCRWLTARHDGHSTNANASVTARLLSEHEWERAARGADGRVYPWGNGFDFAFCKGALSREGKPFPEPVGAYDRDLSVFGVRDLAGCVRELCDGWYGQGYRPVRGGSWFVPSPLVFRADYRTSILDGSRNTDVGFRVC